MEYPIFFISRSDATRLLGTFQTAVRQMIFNWNMPLEKLSMMSPEDSMLVQQWNAQSWPGTDCCIHEMIQQSVLNQPSRPAICSWDGELTYSEMEDLSSRLASYLQNDLSCGSDSVVILCFEKSLWAVISMLAVAKSGAAFVHVDIKAPPERIQNIVRQCRCRVGLCSQKNADKIKSLIPISVSVSAETMKTLRQSTYDIDKSTPGNILYIIFTSGSTGTPKGVVITHRSFCSAVTYNRSWLCIQSDSRVFQFTAYTFDACLEEIFTVLVAGGCICIPTEEERMSDVAGFVSRMNVNWAAFTPSFLRTLDSEELIEYLKFITVHAEPMSASLIQRWADKTKLRPSYGPTECSVTSCVGAPFSKTSNSANIGWPVGCRGWLVHPYNHDVLMPVGAVGELVLEGPIVGSGYLGDPEKTLASFVIPIWSRHSDDTQNQGQCYKTGDLVRYDSRDGSLLFLGRKDPSQVKIRGQRVELSEIEYHLDAFPKVLHSAVVVPKFGVLKSRLVAVLSLTTSGQLPDDEDPEDQKIHLISITSNDDVGAVLRTIQKRLQQTLPAYMLPEEWLVVAKLPMQVSQKLDRRRTIQWVGELSQDVLDLSRSLTSSPAGHLCDTSAMSDVEEEIRNIWSQVLKLPRHRVPLDMSFFQLGGDSIYAIDLMQLCRKSGFVLTTHDVLAHPTVRDLAHVAQASQRTDSKPHDTTRETVPEGSTREKIYPQADGLLSNIDSSLLPFSMECIEAIWPCTPFQRRMYDSFHSRQNRPYLFDSLIEIRKTVTDPHRLVESWKRTIDQNGILRTAFIAAPQRSEKLLQVVLKGSYPNTSLIQFVATEQEVLHQVETRIELLRAQLFKDNAPPVSLQVYVTHQQQQPTEQRVFAHLAMSHLLIDHVSFHHIISDWQRNYESQVVVTAAELHRPSFGLYSNHAYQKQKDVNNLFWTSVLQNANPCLLTESVVGDYPIKGTTHRMRSEKFTIDVTSDLDRFCREAGTTLATVLQFVWAIVLSLQTGHMDVCFGHLVSDRDDADDVLGCGADKIVGPMLGLAIGRVQFSADTGNLLGALHDLHAHNVQAAGHKIFDLEQVEQELGIEITRLFDTLVNIRKVHYQQEHSSDADVLGLQLRSIAKRDPHEVSGTLLGHSFISAIPSRS